MSADHELLAHTYAAFNGRDIDAVLAVMHPEVDWPNGMEGGRPTDSRAHTLTPFGVSSGPLPGR
jgi:hypothetical protein